MSEKIWLIFAFLIAIGFVLLMVQNTISGIDPNATASVLVMIGMGIQAQLTVIVALTSGIALIIKSVLDDRRGEQDD